MIGGVECKPSNAAGVKEEAIGVDVGACGSAAGIAKGAMYGPAAGSCNSGQFPMAYGAYGE
jgi:hypothetical protein